MSVGSDWSIFEVFIASPGDLESERNAVERAIQQWNASVGQTMRTILLSRRWEQLSPRLSQQSHTAAQDCINRAQVDRSRHPDRLFRQEGRQGYRKRDRAIPFFRQVANFAGLLHPESASHARREQAEKASPILRPDRYF